MTSTDKVHPNEAVAGILAMCAAMTCFVISDVFSKLVTADLPIGETIALRGVLSTAIFAVPVLVSGTAPMLREKFSRLWLARIVTEMGGAVTFISAITFLPMANVVAILQTSPLVMSAAAAIVLGERAGIRRWLATIAGFIGVLAIVKPGFGSFSWWSMLAVATTACVVVRDVATRRMDRTIPATLITFTTAAGVTLAGVSLGLFETGWRWPTSQQWLYMLGAAAFVAMAYYFSIEAVRRAELAIVAPFRYTNLPLSLLAGWFIWREVPDVWSLLGIAIIAAAGVATFVRERHG